MKILIILSLILISAFVSAKENEEKYKWYAIVNRIVDKKEVSEKFEITKSYIKIDENIICTVDKEYIRKKFDLYPNLRAKRLTCDFLGKTFFLETACLKSEDLKIVINYEENKFNKSIYYVTCA